MTSKPTRSIECANCSATTTHDLILQQINALKTRIVSKCRACGNEVFIDAERSIKEVNRGIGEGSATLERFKDGTHRPR